MHALPLEIISSILDFALEDEPEEHHNQHLLQWFRVSHAWRGAAARRLYASIDLDEERCRRPRLVALCRTLERSPELTACVKQLSVHLVRMRRLGALCAQLLRLCSGSSSSLTQVTLRGSLPREPRALFENLFELDGLRVLRLELDPLDGVALFSSGASLVSLLAARWPHIEEVKITGDVIWDECVSGAAPASRWLFREEEHMVRTTQLPLTTLDLTRAGTMYTTDLIALRALSLPHMRSFRVHVSVTEEADATCAVLTDCVGAWTANLEELEIELDPQLGELADESWGEDKWVGLSEVIRRLPNLKVLGIDSRLLSLEALLGIPTLSSIRYTDQRDRLNTTGINAFLSMLELFDEESNYLTPYCLPTLTSLALVSTSGNFVTTTALECEALIPVCRRRRISLRVIYHSVESGSEWHMIDETFKPTGA